MLQKRHFLADLLHAPNFPIVFLKYRIRIRFFKTLDRRDPQDFQVRGGDSAGAGGEEEAGGGEEEEAAGRQRNPL